MNLVEIESAVFAQNPAYLCELGSPKLGRIAPLMEAAVMGMQKRDWISVGKRGQLIACLRGASIQSLGNGSSSYKIAPTVGTPGERALQSVGLAIASKRPVLCLVGNAALSDGRFFEALNLAVLKRAPVVFVVLERDLSAMPLSAQSAVGIDSVAMTLGLPMVSIQDGSIESIQNSVQTFRDTEHPALVRIQIA